MIIYKMKEPYRTFYMILKLQIKKILKKRCYHRNNNKMLQRLLENPNKSFYRQFLFIYEKHLVRRGFVTKHLKQTFEETKMEY